MQVLDKQGMTLGARIDERLKVVGISQAELARRVGVRQSTINGLVNGDRRSSRSIVRLAQELRTTPAYLTGHIDDPDEGAPLPSAPAPVVVTLGVVMPPERALARMFEGLLAGIDPEASRDEQALLLAQRLPIGLSQLRDLLPDEATPARELEAAPSDRPTRERQPQS